MTARHRMRCIVFSQSQKKNNRMISYKEFALVNEGEESFVWDRFLLLEKVYPLYSIIKLSYAEKRRDYVKHCIT